jgi:hypothetical protein
MLTVSLVLAGFLLGTSPTHAQTRDGLLNGAAIGAGAGLGVDALFSHWSPSTATSPKRLVFVPVYDRGSGGIVINWRW